MAEVIPTVEPERLSATACGLTCEGDCRPVDVFRVGEVERSYSAPRERAGDEVDRL
jgi:hypothetical protein